MAEELIQSQQEIAPLFNSALETGVRSLVILNAAFPKAFDLTRLTWLDHLVVHTTDFGGPPSLHPDLPQRTGELLVRRRLVEEGIKLMRRLHLLEEVAGHEGIQFRATDEATAIVDSMRSRYARELSERAVWLADRLRQISDDELSKLISERIGRWAVEFQGEINPERSSA